MWNLINNPEVAVPRGVTTNVLLPVCKPLQLSGVNAGLLSPRSALQRTSSLLF
jgi:hypothetical protein